MNKNLTKSQLISIAAKDAGLTRSKTEEVLESILESIKENLVMGKKVNLIGFGSFSTIDKKERKGVNPQTGKGMMIPARTTAKFRAGKLLSNTLKTV
ncbi:MAG: HU family DNA-binding protein [Deltaproteobacteria bacterium]|nr:HU family DNA-binding protein [Deltaproteobacteria bacterium]